MSTFAPGVPALHSHTSVRESERTRTLDSSVPWYIWTGVIAITCATIGAAWDVSWHRSIGRDSFWTPAHLMIQLCAVLAAIIGMWLTVRATFTDDATLRAESVSILGLRAPLGVFLAAWGGLAMLVSAPFDNWWHNAYGLDVKIISPPHTLLILGVRGVGIGMIFLILAAMNRADLAGATNFKKLQMLLLYLGGLTIGGQMFFLQELTFDVVQHRAIAYISMAIALPVVFAMFSQASRFRWAATMMASIYMFTIISEILILPLFPAHPKLGPVYYPVTHMVPASFPVLLFAPALALDLLWQRTKAWKFWQIALVSGMLFTVVLFAVEWPFAKFLLSAASRNRFFGTGYFDYGTGPKSYERLHLFFRPDGGLTLWLGLARASLYGAISTWIGLLFGRWMKSVQR